MSVVIALDVMGGDKAPEIVIEGADLALFAKQDGMPPLGQFQRRAGPDDAAADDHDVHPVGQTKIGFEMGERGAGHGVIYPCVTGTVQSQQQGARRLWHSGIAAPAAPFAGRGKTAISGA